jgi:membrane associated rhomboid family serine protease
MFKNWFPESQDLLPLTWWKQHPIYLSTILAIGGVASMVLFAIVGFEAMSHFMFSFESAFQQGKLWTPFTYAFVNAPGIWTVIGCYLLWRFGEEVERHFGRRIFVKLLLVLLVVAPIAVTLLHLVGLRGMMCAGIMEIEFGVFIAFATLLPRAGINIFIATIDAWILAAIIVGVNALSCIAARDWGSLILLVTTVGSAYVFIRYQKGEIKLPTFIKILPDEPKQEKRTSAVIDEILDKISQNGFDSITPEERAILDDASKKK